MKNLINCLLFLCSSVITFSQEANSPTISVRAGVLMTSTSIYESSGTDTTYRNSLAFAPVVSLVHSKGFSLDYAPYFITSGIQRGIYMHMLTLGYENYDGPRFTVRTGLSHYFFTGNKSIPYSPITNELYFATDYKKAWLRPALSIGLGFGQDQSGKMVSDLYGGIGVKHGFEIENADIFSSIDISPSVFINGGTSNYYSFLTTSKYLSRSKKSSGQSGRGRGNGNSGSGTASVNSFSLTNVELGLYSDLVIQQVHIKPQGSLYFPLRTGETLSGYWQLNLEYYF